MKFKVGDKVRIVWDEVSVFTKAKGCIGTIIDVNERLMYPYKLDIDPKHIYRDSELELVHEEKIVITTDGKVTTATLYKDNEKTVAKAYCSPEDTFDFNVGAKLAMERLMTVVNPVIVNGFKVGDRVNYGGHNGTIICISYDDTLGVEFDNNPNCFHNCSGILLKAGKPGEPNRCAWCYASELKHGEAPNYYNGKVVCVNLNGTNCYSYTVGKIYEFVDGTFTDDNGDEVHEFNLGVRFKSFKEWNDFSNSEWLEIKE